ncbi:MAG: Branched-chain amino acid transporter, amino acid-binding protein, partial [Gemmatimonadetes bacterium]|nr:Branched-chain amino acid transporter, amino acid-binding protein [Gemmatimonadota bacterium]
MNYASFRRLRFVRSTLLSACVLGVSVSGCAALLSLGDWSVVDEAKDASTDDVPPAPDSPVDVVAPDTFVPDCTTNDECTLRATAEGPIDAGVDDADAALPPADGGDAGDAAADAGQPTIPAVCVKSTGKCARLLSTDCTAITGDYHNNDAVVLGSLLFFKGSQATSGIARTQSSQLAIEEINAAGGLPAAIGSSARRPIVLVSCDGATNLLRAGDHLINELHVPGMVGPTTSQDTLDISLKMSIAAGTVIISPNAVASSIGDLPDQDLTWLLVPSDQQRGPLMISQINQIESELKIARSKSTLKLSIIYRNDALGVGSYSALSSLQFNGKPLSDAINAGSPSGNVRLDAYTPTAPNQQPIVTRHAAFQPDIVVLLGAETVLKVLQPLETQWFQDAGPDRPLYLVIDASKNADMIAVTTNNQPLRQRIRGTGVVSEAASLPVFSRFAGAYASRYGSFPNISNMGPSYDATYALAYAIAAVKDLPLTGANIAKGLRKLGSG